jgi:hypothetical protein
MTLLERFEAKYIPVTESGCWLWEAFVDVDGYGTIWDGRIKRSALAHRISYELYRGNPGEFHVLHLCDVRCCVNPNHLFLGTNLDNIADRHKKGRDSKRWSNRPTHCKRGHEFTPENTRLQRGGRLCITCNRIMDAASHRRRRKLNG